MSVAHEGNPRQNSLVVTGANGNLDGNPILTPEIPIGGGAPIQTFTIAASSNWDCINGITNITITVSGGLAPYSVGTSLGNVTALSANTWSLTPPTNSGSGVAGMLIASNHPTAVLSV
jgi:hypothetical protein